MRNWFALTHCFYRLTWFFLALRVTLIFFCLIVTFSLSLHLTPSKCVVCLFFNGKYVLGDCVERQTPLGIECDEDNDFSFILLLRANFRFYCVWFYYIFALRTLSCRFGWKFATVLQKKHKQTVWSRFISILSRNRICEATFLYLIRMRGKILFRKIKTCLGKTKKKIYFI